MVFTSFLSIESSMAIVYGGLAVGIGLLQSGLRNKGHGYMGMMLLTALAATINYGYGTTSDAGEGIAFFISLFDPFYNIGTIGKEEDYPGLSPCLGGVNNCTMLPSYKYHAKWAGTFYTRFTDDAEATSRRGKLYGHIWMNTTAFIICLIQFHEPTRRKYIQLHRKLGWVAITLVTGGTMCSLWLASDHGTEENYGGNSAVAGWISMAATVLGTLVPGVLAVLRKDIPAHKKWMTRFYGSMWGSFLVFRALFFLGRLFLWHKNLMPQIAIWSSAPLGVAIAEWVRLRNLSQEDVKLQ